MFGSERRCCVSNTIGPGLYCGWTFEFSNQSAELTTNQECGLEALFLVHWFARIQPPLDGRTYAVSGPSEVGPARLASRRLVWEGLRLLWTPTVWSIEGEALTLCLCRPAQPPYALIHGLWVGLPTLGYELRRVGTVTALTTGVRCEV